VQIEQEEDPAYTRKIFSDIKHSLLSGFNLKNAKDRQMRLRPAHRGLRQNDKQGSCGLAW
jgi:hypothetical protein